MDKILVDRRMLEEVADSLVTFADNTPVIGFDSMDTLIGCVIRLKQILNFPEIPEKGE